MKTNKKAPTLKRVGARSCTAADHLQRRLVYKPITQMFKDENGSPYYATGIRMEYINGKFCQPLDEIADICPEPEAVAKLAELMTRNGLHPEHFHDVVQNFCENNYKVQGL